MHLLPTSFVSPACFLGVKNVVFKSSSASSAAFFFLKLLYSHANWFVHSSVFYLTSL